MRMNLEMFVRDSALQSCTPHAVADTGADLAEAGLWELWRQHADDGARQRLLDLHLPYARIVAASYYAKRFHDEIEFGDYLQLASLGLIEALSRFDPGVGVQFRTFAARS